MGGSKRTTVRKFNGKVLVDLREFYLDKSTSEYRPGKKGISLLVETWDRLVSQSPSICAAAGIDCVLPPKGAGAAEGLCLNAGASSSTSTLQPTKRLKTEPVASCELKPEQSAAGQPGGAAIGCGGEFMLGADRRVTVSSWKGAMRVDVREYYADKASGELKPGRYGALAACGVGTATCVCVGVWQVICS